MGDERERDVISRAYVFAMVLATYFSLGASVVLAVAGSGILSFLPVLAVGSASWAAMWYCHTEGVDVPGLARRATARRKVVNIAASSLLVVAWAVALTVHLYTGRPLVDVSVQFGDASYTPLVGGVLGALVGVAAVVVAMRLQSARVRKRNASLADEE